MDDTEILGDEEWDNREVRHQALQCASRFFQGLGNQTSSIDVKMLAVTRKFEEYLRNG